MLGELIGCPPSTFWFHHELAVSSSDACTVPYDDTGCAPSCCRLSCMSDLRSSACAGIEMVWCCCEADWEDEGRRWVSCQSVFSLLRRLEAGEAAAAIPDVAAEAAYGPGPGLYGRTVS